MRAGTHRSALKLTVSTLSSSSGVSVCTFAPPVKQVSIEHLNLSVCDLEERGRGGEGDVCMCERVGYGRGGCGLARAMSVVIYR